MINQRTATTFRQPMTTFAGCREACGYCVGLGLAKTEILAPGAVPIFSCNQWGQSPQLQAGSAEGQYFVPGKYLKGPGFLKKLKDFSAQRLILLVDDVDFDANNISELKKKCALEFWIIFTRGQKTLEILEKLIATQAGPIYFYSPAYETNPDLFLTTPELAKVLKKIKSHFPEQSISNPPGVDMYNPTFNSENLKFDHELLVNQTKPSKPQVSVVIPCFNNSSYVIRVLKALDVQDIDPGAFEVIIVDDGSDETHLKELESHSKKNSFGFSYKLIRYFRAENRKMGDDQFRAGLARTLGVSYSKSSIYSFLDSDILVPPNFVSSMISYHKGYDVVQIQRLYLNREATDRIESYGAVDPKTDVFHPDGGYWKKFFEDPRPWQELPAYWKYTCTYGLSVTAEKFKSVNGFRSVFNSYGFEDTDLGYKLYKSGAKFFKAPILGYHLWHAPLKSEFKNSDLLRYRLLQKTGRIFFRHSLDPMAYEEMKNIFYESRPLRQSLKSLFKNLRTRA